MNDQLQKALADLLAKANQGIDAGASFLQAQLPDVIQQLLVWKAVQNLVMIPFMCLAVWGLVKVLLSIHRAKEIGLWRRGSECSWEKGPQISSLAYFAAVVSMLLGSFMAWAAVMNLLTVVKIWLAPKVFLIEYAASLTK